MGPDSSSTMGATEQKRCCCNVVLGLGLSRSFNRVGPVSKLGLLRLAFSWGWDLRVLRALRDGNVSVTKQWVSGVCLGDVGVKAVFFHSRHATQYVCFKLETRGGGGEGVRWICKRDKGNFLLDIVGNQNNILVSLLMHLSDIV